MNHRPAPECVAVRGLKIDNCQSAAMVVGILQVELSIDWAESLKDKRRVVSSVRDTLHREHHVSVAEVASQDQIRTAVLGIVLAASDVGRCQRALDGVLNDLRIHRECVLSDHSTQILTGQ